VTSGLSILNLRVNVSATGNDIVDEIDLKIQKGRVTGLVGESGSGKTTVGLAVLGHARRGVEIVQGEIYCDDTDVLNLDEGSKREIRGSLVSYVPQDPTSSLNPALRIGVQILEVLETHNFGGSDQARSVRVREMMAEVLLPSDDEYLERYPHQLSGGQQQRVVLAMAFACRPAVIVLDEPTTGLDVSTQEHVLKTIRNLSSQHGVAALYITHDLAVVSELADDVAVMYAGRIIEQGSAYDIFNNPSHPYTRHLVAAAPDIAGEQQIVGLAGRAPSPGKRPNGCAFSVRCESVTDDCLSQFPQSVSISQSHFARCINIRKSETSAKPESIKLVKKASSNTVLELRNISAGYGGQSVVEEISLILGRGQCLALVGESGSGKTTVARCIGGLHTEWSGEIFLNNEKLNRGSRQRRIEQRLGIQYIFQNPYGSLNPRRTVGDSIIRPLVISGSTGSTVKKELNEVLEKVSLPSAYSDKFPDQLSGGERQRVAIARALISRPDVLVCDEITSALDVLVQAAVVDLLATLQRDLGLAILFITHNLPLVRSIADEVAVMSDGRIVEFGDTATVIGNPVQEYTQRLISATPSIARSSK
jgi:peptide/nickel transport system ATP-binding protein